VFGFFCRGVCGFGGGLCVGVWECQRGIFWVGCVCGGLGLRGVLGGFVKIGGGGEFVGWFGGGGGVCLVCYFYGVFLGEGSLRIQILARFPPSEKGGVSHQLEACVSHQRKDWVV